MSSFYPATAKNLPKYHMETEFNFTFGSKFCKTLIQTKPPSIHDLVRIFKLKNSGERQIVIVCDSNTAGLAGAIVEDREIPILVLESGEKYKTWDTVQKILKAGLSAGLGRDGIFIGVGGGVISDLTAFAASIYMRGTRLCLVSTTLLGMVDAVLGGKTGIDLFGLKNLAGSFFPAELVVLPLSALDTLPENEFKSGMAELIKTAVLASDDFLELVKKLVKLEKEESRKSGVYQECLRECISRAIAFKGKIVEEDPFETGNRRILLNLGHSFGHALETAAGLGALSHGEAVAWGMARACELGVVLGITPSSRAAEISDIISNYGFETKVPHPLVSMTNTQDAMMKAILRDKKKAGKNLRFVVPGEKSAVVISAENYHLLQGEDGEKLIYKIMNGNNPGKYPL
jgi:3-dehydroquinate synthase